jgi:hypothetical protein
MENKDMPCEAKKACPKVVQNAVESRLFEMHHLMNSINVGEGATIFNNSSKTDVPLLFGEKVESVKSEA